MNFSKKQMIIGAAVLVGGYLLYKKYYKKPVVAPVPPTDQAAAAAAAALAADEAQLEADEDLTDETITGASTEGFLGRGKKKGNPMGNRKERIAKYYLGLIKRGMSALEAEQIIADKIKGNKANKQAKASALAELAEVVSTPKETLNEVSEARKVGGGDGFMSQSFMM